MTKNLKILITSLLLWQLSVIALSGLAHDEAYYWLFSHNLDWGYFDHPPMVAIAIKLFSFLPHSAFALRIGFIAMQFGCLYFLLRLIPQENWLAAVVLFFAFPLASFSGNFALPDMPLLFMSTLYFYLLKQFIERPGPAIAGSLGIAIAFLLYSKYHGILLVFFTILALPRLFKNKYFYLTAFVSLALFIPHIWWQYQHNFATLRYHFLERPSTTFSVGRSLEYLSLQLGLAGVFCGPFIWFRIIKNKSFDNFEKVLKFVCTGVVVFFLVSTFSKKFEANWTIFLAPALIVLSLNFGVERMKGFKVALWSSFALVVLVRVILILPADAVPLKRLKEFQGWDSFSLMLKEKCQAPILANTYQIASKLSFYLQEPIHALNYNSRKNQFDFWIPDETYYLSSSLCYVTDKKQFGGEEVTTPEGKRLLLIRNFSPTQLIPAAPVR
jgi:hypothetical protein